MKNRYSGVLGIIGVVAAGGLFAVLRNFAPRLSTVLLVIGGILLVGLLVLIGVIVFFAFYKPKNKKAADAAREEATQVWAKGRAHLMELRRRTMLVKNQEIRKRNEEICAVADKILHALKEQTDDIPRVRKFFNYYLPTLGSILTKYVRVEESGVPNEPLAESTIECLKNIKQAMEKQYENLFEDDILDLSVEMEVLTQTCKRDGLLSDDNFEAQKDESNITLML